MRRTGARTGVSAAAIQSARRRGRIPRRFFTVCLWIVELLNIRANDDVIVRQLAEVDAWLGDLSPALVTGGRSRTNSTGRPCDVTWFTGPSARP